MRLNAFVRLWFRLARLGPQYDEFGCAREAAIELLRSGSLDGLGAVCEEAGPIEFEVP